MIVRPRQKKASARLERRDFEKHEKNGFPKSPKIGFFGVFGVLPCGYRAKCQNAEKRTFRAHTRDTACPRFWQKRVTSRFFDDFFDIFGENAREFVITECHVFSTFCENEIPDFRKDFCVRNS